MKQDSVFRSGTALSNEELRMPDEGSKIHGRNRFNLVSSFFIVHYPFS